eukprot:scaffold376225_cov17-Prasinocladus_malaysianus.AAC.1
MHHIPCTITYIHTTVQLRYIGRLAILNIASCATLTIERIHAKDQTMLGSCAMRAMGKMHLADADTP